MNAPSTNPQILSVLDVALASLKAKNANPIADSPLFPYKDKIAALLHEQATTAQIAELFSNAGLKVSNTTVARFIKDAKLKRKSRGRRAATASTR